MRKTLQNPPSGLLLKLSEITKEVVKRTGGTKHIAPQLGLRNWNVLNNLLNPYYDSHHLSAENLLKIIRIGKERALPLSQYIALEGGGAFVLFPKAQIPDEELLMLGLRAIEEFGHVATALREMLDPNGEDGSKISIDELETLETEANEAMAILQQIKIGAIQSQKNSRLKSMF